MRNKKGQYCSDAPTEMEIEKYNKYSPKNQDIGYLTQNNLIESFNKPPSVKSIVIVLMVIWFFNSFSLAIKEEIYSKIESRFCHLHNNSTININDFDMLNVTKKKEK